MKLQVVDVVFASDAGYVDQLKISSFSSVYAHRRHGQVLRVHVLDCGIGDRAWLDYSRSLMSFAMRNEVRIEIKRHQIDMTRFSEFPSWTNGSRANWARILLPQLLADVDYCVYSDCDILFLDSPVGIVQELLDSKGALLVGHKNPYGTKGPDGQWFHNAGLPYVEDEYVCSGLIGMNLVGLRNENFIAAVSGFLAKHPNPVSVDQTVLNWFCHGRISLLSSGWGMFNHECHAMRTPVKAIHYSGGWPWCRVKNPYDWIGVYCSKDDIALWNDFRTQIVGLPKFQRAPILTRHKVCGLMALWTCRLLNAFGASFPGHPCFSEMIAMYCAKGTALVDARRRLFAELK